MKTIGFIGLGLIGGSIAKTIRKYHPEARILAYNRRREVTEKALSEGIIDMICSADDAAFGTCDCIFLCAPVRTNISFLPFLRRVIRDDCIVSDAGSVKSVVVHAAEQEGLSSNFIGGHPMAGSEKTGLEAASDALLENAWYFLTPCADVPETAVCQFRDFIASLRAIPLISTGELHDRVVAGVSHIPHIVAASLVLLVSDYDTDDQLMKLVAAGGFRDITRIASSSPEMWEQICMTNSEEISRSLDIYIGLLEDARKLITDHASEKIRTMFSEARDYRDSLNDSIRGSLPRQFVIYLDIQDEAGGIATVTTLLAMSAINIKNIGIVHNREFEEGVLRIEFYDAESRDHASDVLRQRNYTVRKLT